MGSSTGSPQPYLHVATGQRNLRKGAVVPFATIAVSHTAEEKRSPSFTAPHRGGRKAQVPQEGHLSCSPWPKHFPSTPHTDGSRFRLWGLISPVRKLENKCPRFIRNRNLTFRDLQKCSLLETHAQKKHSLILFSQSSPLKTEILRQIRTVTVQASQIDFNRILGLCSAPSKQTLRAIGDVPRYKTGPVSSALEDHVISVNIINK